MGRKRDKKKRKEAKRDFRQAVRQAAKDGEIRRPEIRQALKNAEEAGVKTDFLTKKLQGISDRKDATIKRGAKDLLGIDPKPDGGDGDGDGDGNNTTGASVTENSVFEDTRIKTKGLGPYDKLLGYDKDGKPRPLTRKINKYEKFLSGETHKSKKYLKELRESATTRMQINPRAYGRKSLKTDFDKLSFAEKYDKNKTRTLRQLSTPLRKFLKKDDDDPLNNFNLNKKGQVKKLKFSERRMRKFVNNESDLFGDIREAAGGLGTDSSATGTDRVKNTLGRIKSRGATSNTAEVKSQLYTRPKLVRG